KVGAIEKRKIEAFPVLPARVALQAREALEIIIESLQQRAPAAAAERRRKICAEPFVNRAEIERDHEKEQAVGQARVRLRNDLMDDALRDNGIDAGDVIERLAQILPVRHQGILRRSPSCDTDVALGKRKGGNFFGDCKLYGRPDRRRQRAVESEG